MARYEILREFISEKDWADLVYDQCMIFDLYARERLKSVSGISAVGRLIKNSCRDNEKIYGNQVILRFSQGMVSQCLYCLIMPEEIR